jgi:hypothetical protein
VPGDNGLLGSVENVGVVGVGSARYVGRVVIIVELAVGRPLGEDVRRSVARRVASSKT